VIELLLNAESALALGLLDSAERTYRTVLEADPRNGIAAVGLARVALERGDEASAHALAQAALEIDPENATAGRMLDRLDEVARFRDAAAASPAEASPAAAPDPPADPPADSPSDSPIAPALPAAAITGIPNPTDASNTASPARPGLRRRLFRRS